jgi:hypothetical protein
MTDAGGNYQFNYVPTDSFIVRVSPDKILNPNAMTSYFKEPIWCYRWDSAGVFHTHCDSGTVQKDVKLVEPTPLTGNLNGYVYEYTGSFSKQPGDPIPGIDITVEQSPGGIVGAATSGGGGYYDLSNLDNSATYVISIDFPGLPHDSIYTMQINLNDTTLDSLNFYVDSTGIYILAQPLGTSVNPSVETNISLELYPNPSNGPFNLNINAIEPTNILLEITNEFGQLMSVSQESLQGGVNTIRLDTESLPSGVYFVTAKDHGQLFVRKLIKL